MNLIMKLLVHHFIGNPEGRLEVKRSMSNVIMEGKPMLKKIEDLTKSRTRFWLLAPFAWEARNLRKPWCLLWAGAIVCFLFFVPISAVQCFIWFLNRGDLLSLLSGVLFPLLLLLAVPTFLIFSIDSAIQSEPREHYAWLRCWLVLTSYVKRKRLQSIGEIEEELTLLLEPLSPREYSAIRKRSIVLGRISLLLISLHIVAWIYLSSYGSHLLESWRDTGIGGLFYIGSLVLAMIPGMVGIVQENAKKPVRVLERDLHLLTESSKDGLSVDRVFTNYENAMANRKLKRNAVWFYYFGALCAWDLEKLAMASTSSILLSFCIAANLMWPAFSSDFLMKLITLMASLLFFYMVIEAWINGGGVAKALQRFGVIKMLKAGRTPSSIITVSSMIECFSAGGYEKPAKFATTEDYVTKLYIRSLKRTMLGR